MFRLPTWSRFSVLSQLGKKSGLSREIKCFSQTRNLVRTSTLHTSKVIFPSSSMQNSRRSLLLASTGIVSGLTLHLVSSERREEQSRRFLKAVKSGPVGEVRKHIKSASGGQFAPDTAFCGTGVVVRPHFATEVQRGFQL